MGPRDGAAEGAVDDGLAVGTADVGAEEEVCLQVGPVEGTRLLGRRLGRTDGIEDGARLLARLEGLLERTEVDPRVGAALGTARRAVGGTLTGSDDGLLLGWTGGNTLCPVVGAAVGTQPPKVGHGDPLDGTQLAFRVAKESRGATTQISEWSP